MNNVALSDRVQTLTNEKIIPKVVDTVLNSNVFANRILSKTKKWTGRQLSFPVKTAKNNTGGSFSGLDTFSITVQDNKKKLLYYPSFYRITTAIPLTEIAVNDTDDMVLDLFDITMSQDAQDGADDIGTMFYGDGTGNSNKDFWGLGTLVDDGTTASTIGGLSRATYPTLNSTVDASSATLSLSKMHSLYNSAKSGNIKPTVGLCDETVFALYASLLAPQERINKDAAMMKNGIRGGTGFVGLDFMGFQILADEKCTSGVLFMLNEDYIDFYALPMPGTKPVELGNKDVLGNDYTGNLGFSSTGILTPIDQAAHIVHTYLGGQLVTSNPKRHAKATGLTTV